MKNRIRVNGVIIGLAALIVIVLRTTFLRVSFGRIDAAAEIAGMALLLFGFLVRISSRGYKSEFSGGGHALVKGGPYAVVRNPMYVGIFCIGSGIILMCFQWWALWIFIVFMGVRYYTLTLKEEKKLVEFFGEEYREYMNKVPRFFPKAGVCFQSRIDECLPLRLNWMKKELSSLFPVLFVIVLVKAWKNAQLKRACVCAGFEWYALVVIIFSAVVFYLAKIYEKKTK